MNQQEATEHTTITALVGAVASSGSTDVTTQHRGSATDLSNTGRDQTGRMAGGGRGTHARAKPFHTLKSVIDIKN